MTLVYENQWMESARLFSAILLKTPNVAAKGEVSSAIRDFWYAGDRIQEGIIRPFLSGSSPFVFMWWSPRISVIGCIVSHEAFGTSQVITVTAVILSGSIPCAFETPQYSRWSLRGQIEMPGMLVVKYKIAEFGGVFYKSRWPFSL